MALAEARRQVDAVRVADRWQLSAGGSVRCRPRRPPPVDPSRESAPLIDPRFPGRTIVIPAFTGRDSDGAGRKKEGRRAPKDDTFRGTAPGKPARIAAAGFPGRVPGVAATRVHHPGQADRNNAGRFRSVGTAARRRDHRDLRDCPRGGGGTGPTPPRTAGEWGDGCRVAGLSGVVQVDGALRPQAELASAAVGLLVDAALAALAAGISIALGGLAAPLVYANLARRAALASSFPPRSTAPAFRQRCHGSRRGATSSWGRRGRSTASSLSGQPRQPTARLARRVRRPDADCVRGSAFGGAVRGGIDSPCRVR